MNIKKLEAHKEGLVGFALGLGAFAAGAQICRLVRKQIDRSHKGKKHPEIRPKQGAIVPLSNPHLAEIKSDFMYHLGLGGRLPGGFGDFSEVRFVCMGGSPTRARAFAHRLALELGISFPSGLKPIGKTERYSLYKVGPVLSVSHGMGLPSLSILLHEITKLLHHAGATHPIPYIRMGTCGGIGVEPGTSIITTETVDELCQPVFRICMLDKEHFRPTKLCPDLRKALQDAACDMRQTPGFSQQRIAHRRATFESWSDEKDLPDTGKPIRTATGKTLAANGFYEQQARLDGAISCVTAEERLAWLHRIHARGVRNIEMESVQIGAFGAALGIPCAIVCAALLNRFKGDAVLLSKEELNETSMNPQRLVIRYIRSQLEATN